MLVNHKIQIFLDFSKFHPKAPIQFPGQDAPRPLPSPVQILLERYAYSEISGTSILI